MPKKVRFPLSELNTGQEMVTYFICPAGAQAAESEFEGLAPLKDVRHGALVIEARIVTVRKDIQLGQVFGQSVPNPCEWAVWRSE
jgi:hypothetical protein